MVPQSTNNSSKDLLKTQKDACSATDNSADDKKCGKYV